VQMLSTPNTANLVPTRRTWCYQGKVQCKPWSFRWNLNVAVAADLLWEENNVPSLKSTVEVVLKNMTNIAYLS
jgi:hypothetical protein